MITDQQIQDKIDKKVFVSGDCWIWIGSINKVGHPQVTFDHRQKEEGKMLTFFPHEFLYEQKFGQLEVRYLDSSCGNLRCINPDHQSPRTFEKRMDNYLVQDNGCWLWNGTSKTNGYGTMPVNGKTKMVHRLAYEKAYGEIPEGLMVCHKCNTRLCINPDHLYVGTHNDNMKDMANSDVMKGEANPQSILTQSQVLEIRQHIQERKIVYRELAKMYGVSRTAIKDIASGRTWGWLE